MELRERIAAVRTVTDPDELDALAEVRERVHGALISELGPQLAEADIDDPALRERVLAQARGLLVGERGLSVADRERLAVEVADDASTPRVSLSCSSSGPASRPSARDAKSRRVATTESSVAREQCS